MKNITHISFDLDGTLVDCEFNDCVWFRGIPELIAKERSIPLDDAVSLARAEYDRIGDRDLKWYDIKFWLRHFGLNGRWDELLIYYKDRINLYPEVMGVLERLKDSLNLIIISNASREFLDIETMETNIRSFFSYIYSATSDFKQVKKTDKLYRTVCNNLKIKPQDLIHVGDHFDFDYIAPQKIGITAFFLDREGSRHGDYVIRNLEELEVKIENLKPNIEY